MFSNNKFQDGHQDVRQLIMYEMELFKTEKKHILSEHVA